MTFKADVKREVNGEILKERADVIQFKDGYYETEDEKKIAFIKRHSEFGLKIFVVEERKKEDITPEEQKIINDSIVDKPIRRMGRPKKVVNA